MPETLKLYKVITLWEGTTAETEVHAVFSRLAQDVEVEVTGGGSLLSAEIYGRSADLTLSTGTKRIAIRGTPLMESSSVLRFAVGASGETDAEENPLITRDDAAAELADHVANYLVQRGTYDVEHRGSPELETGDLIGLQTWYKSEMDAVVLSDNTVYRGTLHGAAKLKGVAQSASVKLTSVIAAIPSQRGVLIYNGDALFPEWDGYHSGQLLINGTLSGVDVGVYPVTFTPRAGCAWWDGTTEPKESSWVIDHASISAVPEQRGVLVYSAEALLPEWNEDYDPRKLSLSVTAQTLPGAYTALFTPKGGFVWWDGTQDAKSADWSIEEASVVDLPTVSGVLTYNGTDPTNGTEQSPRWTGYNERKLTMSGVTAAARPGVYYTAFRPNAGYCWDDMTVGEKSVAWEILAKGIQRVAAQSLSFPFDGREHYPSWRNYNANQILIAGTVTPQKRLGSYETCFTPKNNFVWNDTQDAETDALAWTVGSDPSENKLTVPSPSSSPTYNGREQTARWNNYEPSKMDVSGEFAATNGGYHAVTFMPKDGYVWRDGSSRAQMVDWEIKRASPNLRVSPERAATVVGGSVRFSYYTASYADNDVRVPATWAHSEGVIHNGVVQVTMYTAGTVMVEIIAYETGNCTEEIAAVEVEVREE